MKQGETQRHTLALSGLERTDKKIKNSFLGVILPKVPKTSKIWRSQSQQTKYSYIYFTYTIYNFPTDMERMQMIIILSPLVVKRENLDTCCDYSAKYM